MATKPAAKASPKKAAPAKAAAKPAAKKAAPVKAPAPAKKPAKAVTPVFEGDVKVKKSKPTVSTETILARGAGQVSKIFT